MTSLHLPEVARRPLSSDRLRRRGPHVRPGLTVTEVLVAVLAVALLVAAIGPVARRVQLDSGQLVSAANLQKIAVAHAMYAADWDDRQVTWCPDDLGISNGSFQAYSASFTCPQPMLLGFSETGGVWGQFLACHGTGAGWFAGVAYVPNGITNPTQLGVGSFRQIGARAFAAYVDGRHYSKTLYAPNDTLTWQLASPYFEVPVEFTVLPAPNDSIVNSSYALSPAAMWHPAVLSENPATGLWYRSPYTFGVGARSPTVSQCVHPALKTRTIEHHWNLGQPAPVNPAFANQTPYLFSHGVDAAPVTLFFDGRVAELANAHVADDDATALAGSGGKVGLWSRDTPVGDAGYFGAQSYDGFVTGHHILTAGGILGRDILSVEPNGDGGVAAAAPRRTIPRERIEWPTLPMPVLQDQ